MDNTMKKRWISLYVENQVGVLSKISGLFSGKSYNSTHSVRSPFRYIILNVQIVTVLY